MPPVIESMEHRVHVALEDAARVRGTQHPASAVQQGCSDLRLDAGQGTRDAGLADTEDVRHFCHGHAVGDLLEPAQRVDVHKP